MKSNSSWNQEDISLAAWAELALHLKACVARRIHCESLAHESLLAWGRRLLPHYFAKPPSLMHRWLADELDAMTGQRGTKLNVIGPRGGAKSTLGTLAYVLRAAVEGWEPYIWIISDTARQAAQHLENIKLELVNNSQLATDYPRAFGEGSMWRTGAITLNNDVTIEAFGTGQKLRGRRLGPSRPTLIVCDDLQNDEHMRSAARRENSRAWFEGTLLKAGMPQTNIVNLATALHRDALALRLDRTPGWTSRVFQSISQWPLNMSLWHEWEQLYCDLDQSDPQHAAREFYEAHRAEMDAGAILLWPELEDLYTLMKMRVEGGRTAFEREKQGSPLSPDACEWPADYFAEHLWFEEWPANLRTRVIALDPSKGSDARRGDYSAYVILGVSGEGLLYIDADLARRATPEIVATGAELARTFRPDAFGIETNQFQQLLADELAAEFRAQGIVGIEPWSIDNRVSKQVRIRRLGPYLSARRLRFKHDSPGARLLVQQLQEFPAADHDDGPDALEMAIRLAGELCSGATAGDNLGDRLPVSV
jgi:predicted phage terminase large subunit-like protein